MSAVLPRQKPSRPPRPPSRRRKNTSTVDPLERDLDHYRFDLVALTLLFRGLNDALHLARMQEVARRRHARKRTKHTPSNPLRPFEDEDLIAYA